MGNLGRGLCTGISRIFGGGGTFGGVPTIFREVNRIFGRVHKIFCRVHWIFWGVEVDFSLTHTACAGE